MLKRIMLISLALMASVQTPAFSRQSQPGSPELPAVSLCHLTSHLDRYEEKVVCVEASIQPIYLYSHAIGLILTGPECDPVDAYFESADDEVAVLNTLLDAETEQAQVTLIGRLRGPLRADSEYSRGMKGVFKYQVVIESIRTIKPVRKSN